MTFYPSVHVEDKPIFRYCNTASAWLRERRKKHSRFHMVWASFWILIHHCWFTPSFKSALQLSECAVCLWRSTGECWFSSHLLAKSGQAGKMFLSRSPQSFWHQRPVSWKSIFSQMGMAGRIVEAVMREMGSHGKWLMKLRWLTHHSSPAVTPSSPNRGSRTSVFEDCQIIRTYYTQQLQPAHICSLNVWISSNIPKQTWNFLFRFTATYLTAQSRTRLKRLSSST